MAWLPAFSSSPPGISTTLSAFSRSMISTSAAEACAASTQRTNRSTRSGMAAMSGTQRHPSISAVPLFTMRIRSRANPSRNRLLTMMCPGFMRSDTPMMATERGSSNRDSLAMGRTWRPWAPAGSRRSLSRTSRATTRPSFATTNGLTSNSPMRWPSARPSSRNEAASAAIRPSGSSGACPRIDLVANCTTATCWSAASTRPASASDGEKSATSWPGRNAFARNSV